MFERVTPNFESVPERVYIASGSIISCYKICNWRKPESYEAEPLFVIDAGSSEVAQKIMSDMYYGEYTGA